MAVGGDDLTRLLNEVRLEDDQENGPLFEKVYEELRRIAARYMTGEAAGHTLQATAVVHEAYLELFTEGKRDWRNRTHFFAYAARVMRHILVRHAKAKMAVKRGGDLLMFTLDKAAGVCSKASEMVALDEALTRLAQWDKRKARLVELRFFAGLSIEETAAAAGLSHATIYNELKIARGWLFHELRGGV